MPFSGGSSRPGSPALQADSLLPEPCLSAYCQVILQLRVRPRHLVKNSTKNLGTICPPTLTPCTVGLSFTSCSHIGCFMYGSCVLGSHLPCGQKKKHKQCCNKCKNHLKWCTPKKKKKGKEENMERRKTTVCNSGFSEVLAFFFKMCNLDINYSFRTSSSRSVLLCQHSGMRTICPRDYDLDDALLRRRSVPPKRCSAVFETEIPWQIL